MRLPKWRAVGRPEAGWGITSGLLRVVRLQTSSPTCSALGPRRRAPWDVRGRHRARSSAELALTLLRRGI